MISALGKIVGSIILGLFLIGLIFSSAFAQFTEYNNLQPVFVGLISMNIPINESEFPQMKAMLMQQCQQPGVTFIDSGALGGGAATGGGFNLTLKCSDIIAATSAAQLAELAATGLFDSIYYKNYTCDFISCLSTLQDQEKFAIMSSAHAHNFLNQVITWCIAGIAVGLLLIIVSIRKPFGIAKTVGIEMIVSGVIAYVGMSLMKGIISGVPSEVAAIANGLFSTLQNNLMTVIAIGAFLFFVAFAGARLTKPKAKVKKKK